METPHTEELLEDLEKDQTPFYEGVRTRVQAWGKILAFAALMSGATTESFSTENKPTSKEQEKASTTHVESVEYKKQQQVNDICHKNGFDLVDAHSGVMEVHLPPEEVKKVIIYIGQSHPMGSFDSVPKQIRDQVVTSQQTIFRLLQEAYNKTHHTVPALQEGITDAEDATVFMPDPISYASFLEFNSAVCKSNSPIDKIVSTEITHISKYIEAKPDEKDKQGFKAVTLFDMSVAARSLLERKDLSDKEIHRIETLSKKYESHVDHNRLTYKLGGAAIASRFGYAELCPAEDRQANLNVARKVSEELGIPYNENKDFYDVLQGLSPSLRKKAYTLLPTFAKSKEREIPTLQKAENKLDENEVVVLLYGNDHSFDESIKDEYAHEHMKNTAVVKIDSKNVVFGK